MPIDAAPRPTHCADCSAAIVPPPGGTGAAGYARLPDGGAVCYPCADSRQRIEIATADRYSGYLSADGRTVTTWTGGALARVVSATRHRGGFGGEWWSVAAGTSDGARWYGRGGGPGMFLNLRRCRVAEKRASAPA